MKQAYIYHTTFILVYYLTLVFADTSNKILLDKSSKENKQFIQEVLEPDTDNYCKPYGQIKDTCCDFQSVESIQGNTFSKIQDLVRTKFFKYYKLNLWRECPFWNDDGLCMNRDCNVETIDESLLPKEWRQESLGAITMSPVGSSFQPFQVCTFKDQDFCLIDDPSDKDIVYVNLLDNPERFTGYTGPSAEKVWKSIYEENCFNIVHKMSEGCPTCSLPKMDSTLSSGLAAIPSNKQQLGELLDELAETPDDSDEVCLEKRVYYRLISGLHSSISIHICDEYFDRSTGKWGPNLECFVNRIGTHPERLQNIYFTYAVILRAITKLDNYLAHYPFQTGDQSEDDRIKGLVNDLVKSAKECPTTFDEKTMFKSADSRALYVEFRDHFRNVSRIMDCVGCQKCRLWGKIQVTGLGTALKVLFAYNEKSLSYKFNPNLLKQSEVVALFNTFNRLSESLHSIQKFRKIYYDRSNPKLSLLDKVCT
ncbi:endoplasmic reticulum Oxidoreductin 1-domain-containing protein [Cunninghamella echinulata]|nr:endoplasmic reticulum Oxidoreductin 1-domain-containing protein [Cunninghamella echinulata]